MKQPVPPPRTNAPSKALDEITNKVYEDILQEKSASAFTKPKSDKGSVKVSLLNRSFMFQHSKFCILIIE